MRVVEMAAKVELPKVGDHIPVGKFHVSEMNVRFGLPFGEDEEDQILIRNLRHGNIVEAFSARPEGDGYGVYKGRRRFLAKKMVGAKYFVVGKDCLIANVSDEEARDASWIENLELLRKGMDPVTRAKKLQERIAFSPLTLRQIASKDGVGASTYSEWLSILDLNEKMRDVVAEGLITFSDARVLAKLKLGTDKQDELAELVRKEGVDAFKAELERIPTGKMKVGIPKDVYIVLRAILDKRYKPDLELYEELTKLAKAKGMKVDECYKWVLREYIKSTR